MDVKQEINDWFESRSAALFNSNLNQQYSTYLNNLNSYDIDLLVKDMYGNTGKVDVQYSFGFKRFGDVRIDLMSAGIKKDEWKDLSVRELNAVLEKSQTPYTKLQEMFHIKKKGKYFDNNKMLGVFYFIYNENKPENLTVNIIKDQKIAHLLYLPKEVLMKEITNPQINHEYKINDKQKNGLVESHDSAFICLKLKNLVQKYSLPIYNNRLEFESNFFNYFDTHFKKALGLVDKEQSTRVLF